MYKFYYNIVNGSNFICKEYSTADIFIQDISVENWICICKGSLNNLLEFKDIFNRKSNLKVVI